MNNSNQCLFDNVLYLPDSFHLLSGLAYLHLDHLKNGPSVGLEPLKIHRSWHMQELRELYEHRSLQIFDECLREMQKEFSLHRY